MLSWEDVRTKFPACSKYVYLNTAGGAPMSVYAAIEGKRYYDEMLLMGDTCWEEWLERAARVRNKVATYLGAQPGELAFMPNASTGMAIVAQMLRGAGRVLAMADEFPVSTIPWMNLGYPVDFIKPVQGTYPVEYVEEFISDSHKILVVSAIQYRTGYRHNLGALGQLCRKKGVYFVVNATQSFGIFALDVSGQQIDFLTFSSLKWAGAGYGAGGLVARREHLEERGLPLFGWRSVMNPEAMDNRVFDTRMDASSLEGGSPSFPNIFTLGGALDLILELGAENCANRVLELCRKMEKLLMEKGIGVVPAPNEECRSGILYLPSDRAHSIASYLKERNILVSVRGNGIRISVNIFNNSDDIEKLGRALTEVL